MRLKKFLFIQYFDYKDTYYKQLFIVIQLGDKIYSITINCDPNKQSCDKQSTKICQLTTLFLISFNSRRKYGLWQNFTSFLL